MKHAFSSTKRIGRYIKPYRLTFYLVILFTILTVAFNTVLPHLTGLPTAEISRNIAAGESINFDYIIQCLIWILVAGTGYCVVQFLPGLLMTNVVQQSMRDLRRDIKEKINRLPVSYFNKNQQGNISSRVTNDVGAVNNAMQQGFINIVSAVLGIVMVVVMIFLINPLMAVFSVTMIPLSLIISRTIVKISQKYFQGMRSSLEDLNGYVQENMTGFSVLKLYGREKETLKGFKQVNHRLSGFGFKTSFISGSVLPLVQMTAYGTYIGVAVLGSYYVVTGVIVVGQLQAFIQYIWQINQPMGNITQLSAVLQSAPASTMRIFEILDEPKEEPSDQDVPSQEPILGSAEFENVSLSYDPEKPLIRNLNFKVDAGQVVAIMGPTGAGKTTLINLLMRFYDVAEGAVKIDGIDTKEMNRSDAQSVFGMILQDAWLYKGTIADNIRFGKLDATDYEVVGAARTANVDHFIRIMSDGYEIEINSEGNNVPPGRKQLLTIARAIISDPKVLILDEATSSIDTRLKVLIQKAMDRVMEGRMSFVIAHRLSTIREADLILVMRQGEIIEKGTYHELLEQGDFYGKLYNSQFAEEGDYEE